MDAPRPVTGSTSDPFVGTIVALGGGGFSMSETGESAIDDWLLAQAHARRRATVPRVCFIPTAAGDSRDYCGRFEAAFAGRAETHVLSLFGHDPWGYRDPEMLLGMDLVYVGGGSTANLLVLWRLHGLDTILREAARNGTILAGISAGANCWFEGSSTDSFGPLAPLRDGLGFLAGSACPHFHGEEGRAASFRTWIGSAALPGPGYGIDDGTALVFEDGTLTSALSEKAGAGAYLVDGTSETALGTTPLSGPA